MTDSIRVKKADVPDGVAVRVEGGPYGICLVRIGESFYALADRCSHANVELSLGDVDQAACLVECWKHGSTFSLLDGRPQCLPAIKPVPVYSVTVEEDDVVVTIS
jgi:3-phenylpropionate/trans-cinnamate dioxygenase ferredoxin subunit